MKYFPVSCFWIMSGHFLKPVDMPDGLNQEEKERIDACIFTVGPTWHKALKENVNHIDTNR